MIFNLLEWDGIYKVKKLYYIQLKKKMLELFFINIYLTKWIIRFLDNAVFINFNRGLFSLFHTYI